MASHYLCSIYFETIYALKLVKLTCKNKIIYQLCELYMCTVSLKVNTHFNTKMTTDLSNIISDIPNQGSNKGLKQSCPNFLFSGQEDRQ